MDFGIIRQLKVKKFWWLDTILYFVVALLMATIFSFLIFTVKISGEKKNIGELEVKISNTGTAQQKQLEKEVFEYQNKIDNFATLLNAHKIPSKVFDALKALTLPNVWFSNFTMDAKTSAIQVTGETDDIPSLSRQIEIMETQDFITDVSGLTFSLEESGKIMFGFSIMLSPEIFFALEEPAEDQVVPDLPGVPVIDTTSPSTAQPFINLYSNL